MKSMNENLIEGFEDEVNIDSAEQLIEQLEMLPVSELPLHMEDIKDKVSALREQQDNGIDAANIRIAIARLTQLREKAENE